MFDYDPFSEMPSTLFGGLFSQSRKKSPLTIRDSRKRQASSSQDRPDKLKVPRTSARDDEEGSHLSECQESDDNYSDSDGETDGKSVNKDQCRSDDESSECETRTENSILSDAYSSSDPSSSPPHNAKIASDDSPTSTETSPTTAGITPMHAAASFARADKDFREAVKSLKALRTKIDECKSGTEAKIAASTSIVRSLKAERKKMEDRLIGIAEARIAFTSRLSTLDLEQETIQYVYDCYADKCNACMVEKRNLEANIAEREKILMTLNKAMERHSTTYEQHLNKLKEDKEKADSCRMYWNVLKCMLEMDPERVTATAMRDSLVALMGPVTGAGVHLMKKKGEAGNKADIALPWNGRVREEMSAKIG